MSPGTSLRPPDPGVSLRMPRGPGPSATQLPSGLRKLGSVRLTAGIDTVEAVIGMRQTLIAVAGAETRTGLRSTVTQPDVHGPDPGQTAGMMTLTFLCSLTETQMRSVLGSGEPSPTTTPVSQTRRLRVMQASSSVATTIWTYAPTMMTSAFTL